MYITVRAFLSVPIVGLLIVACVGCDNTPSEEAARAEKHRRQRENRQRIDNAIEALASDNEDTRNNAVSELRSEIAAVQKQSSDAALVNAVRHSRDSIVEVAINSPTDSPVRALVRDLLELVGDDAALAEPSSLIQLLESIDSRITNNYMEAGHEIWEKYGLQLDGDHEIWNNYGVLRVYIRQLPGKDNASLAVPFLEKMKVDIGSIPLTPGGYLFSNSEQITVRHAHDDLSDSLKFPDEHGQYTEYMFDDSMEVLGWMGTGTRRTRRGKLKLRPSIEREELLFFIVLLEDVEASLQAIGPLDSDEVVAQLDHDNVTIRRNATKYILRQDEIPPGAIEKLDSMVDDPDAKTAAMATELVSDEFSRYVSSLRRVSDETLSPEEESRHNQAMAAKLLKELPRSIHSEQVRIDALILLRQVGVSPKAADVCGQLIANEASDDLRIEALKTLRHVGPLTETAELCKQLVANETSDNLRTAALQLIRVHLLSHAGPLPELADVCKNIIADETSNKLRIEALHLVRLHLLRHVGSLPSLADLCKQLIVNGTSDDLRIAAVQTLRNIGRVQGSDKLIPIVAALINDDNIELRREAAATLEVLQR